MLCVSGSGQVLCFAYWAMPLLLLCLSYQVKGSCCACRNCHALSIKQGATAMLCVSDNEQSQSFAYQAKGSCLLCLLGNEQSPCFAYQAMGHAGKGTMRCGKSCPIMQQHTKGPCVVLQEADRLHAQALRVCSCQPYQGAAAEAA